MPCSSGELWGHHLMPQRIELDIFLPTGIVIPLKCSRDQTLIQIKAQIWRVGPRYPFFNKLEPDSKYVFQSVTSDAKKEEFHDEMRRLCDLHLFSPFLKLVEFSVSTDGKQESILNSQISVVIGSPVHQLDELDVHEVIEFRRDSVNSCKEIASHRDQSQENHAMYAFCAQLGKRIKASQLGYNYFDDGLMLKVWITTTQAVTVKVHMEANADTVIGEIFLNSSKRRVCEDLLHKSEYVLKVCAHQEYLLGSYPITTYKHIQDCARRKEVPQLEFVEKKKLYSFLPVEAFITPSYYRRKYRNSENEASNDRISLRNIPGRFRVQVLWATFINATENVCVKAGIFHGDEQICSIQETTSVSNGSPRWNEYLNFDLNLKDLPRSARLCISLCCVPRNKKRQEAVCMIAWGNINLFDFRGKLITGKNRLDLLRAPISMDAMSVFYPLGVPAMKRANLDVEITSLELEFDRYSSPVYYPSLQDMLNMASISRDDDDKVEVWLDSQADEAFLKELVNRDALCEVSEQDKVLVWKYRKYCCCNLPNSLPRLVGAVNWSSMEQTVQFYELLQDWPPVNIETALALLDCKCVDLYVREFAVRNLERTLDDSDIFDLLLQLVQSLKYEPYIQSDLGMFLLRKSLTNRVIGNFFFWHLRSEINGKASWVDVRFALILEAYCRGLCGHIKEYNKQVEALEKLTMLAESLKDKPNEHPRDRHRYAIEQIKQQDFLEVLENLISPVCPSIEMGSLNVHECKILSSAKRPLWLEWKNNDSLAPLGSRSVSIIFKIGDDLRQDMLTLQVIRTMDELWRQEGLDLNILTYIVLATGKQVGVIQVVPQSHTVYKIQRKAGTLAAFQVNSKPLHKFLQEKNPEAEYYRAIDTFTRSCAGYCVATFILGIGDRHPDNIMISEDGHIFHIDFGHFLGHFKKKFGISRERVPFVLTDDFITVIAKGASEPRKSVEFQEFQILCGRAYLILRKHANLLISLFTLMLPTGIPELQSVADIDYVRKTLAVDMNDAEALNYFQTMFCGAYEGGWVTKLDWFFHSVNHMNIKFDPKVDAPNVKP